MWSYRIGENFTEAFIDCTALLYVCEQKNTYIIYTYIIYMYILCMYVAKENNSIYYILLFSFATPPPSRVLTLVGVIFFIGHHMNGASTVTVWDALLNITCLGMTSKWCCFFVISILTRYVFSSRLLWSLYKSIHIYIALYQTNYYYYYWMVCLWMVLKR